MPHVDKEALESLLWEARERDPRGSWSISLDLGSDDGAARALDHARQKLRLLQYDASLNKWLLAAVCIAGAVPIALAGDAVTPVEAWYEWPLVWIAGVVLVAIGLTVVYMVTFFVHDFWWQRFGRGRRDAEFYGDPLTRRPGAGSRPARRS